MNREDNITASYNSPNDQFHNPPPPPPTKTDSTSRKHTTPDSLPASPDCTQPAVRVAIGMSASVCCFWN